MAITGIRGTAHERQPAAAKPRMNKIYSGVLLKYHRMPSKIKVVDYNSRAKAILISGDLKPVTPRTDHRFPFHDVDLSGEIQDF